MHGSGLGAEQIARKKVDEFGEDSCWAFLKQMFPSHITDIISKMFVDSSLFENDCDLPLNQWASTWWASFYHLMVEVLLAV